MIRKLKLFVIASATLVILTACSVIDLDFLDGDFEISFEQIMGLFLSDNDEQTVTDEENEFQQSSEGTTEDNDGDENEGEEEVSSNLGLEKIANNDIEKIFNNMAKAVKPVESVSSVATSNTVDDEGNETKTITKVKTIIDPLVVHIEFEGDVQLMEMYADENEVFANLPGQGWVSSPDFKQYLKHVSQQINEDHILHFNNYLEYFEATSDDTHYIITYTGPDEMYGEIFMNEEMLDEVFGELSGVVEGLAGLFDLDSSGEVTMKVWKDTFLIDEQIMETKSKTSVFGFEMETEEHTVQKLTYDEVEPFSIPEEIKQSAENLY